MKWKAAAASKKKGKWKERYLCLLFMLELGGWQGLADWAKSDPDNQKVFYSLYSKLIPQDVNANVTTIEVEFK
jgi:hypothetical protein